LVNEVVLELVVRFEPLGLEAIPGDALFRGERPVALLAISSSASAEALVKVKRRALPTRGSLLLEFDIRALVHVGDLGEVGLSPDDEGTDSGGTGGLEVVVAFVAFRIKLALAAVSGEDDC